MNKEKWHWLRDGIKWKRIKVIILFCRYYISLAVRLIHHKKSNRTTTTIQYSERMKLLIYIFLKTVYILDIDWQVGESNNTNPLDQNAIDFFFSLIVSEIFQNITRFWWHFQLKTTHFGKRCLWTSVGSSAKFSVFLWQSWNSVENSCKKNKRKKTNRTEICFTKGAIDSNVWQLYKVPFYLEYLTFIFIYIN